MRLNLSRPRLRILIVAAFVMAMMGAGGCATRDGSVAYYWQSVTGHLSLMQAAKPVDEWVEAPLTPDALKQRLRATQAMRDFAIRKLHLPDNNSYRRYADLGRKAAVWNVVAAPRLSLDLHRWCFPVVGCVGYRGYYDEEEAKSYASTLPSDLDVNVYPVPAYSTLGWTNWLGGDPLLNTFIGYPEAELARLMFHELAHQVVYVQGDTMFNESFASAVERLGGQQWLQEDATVAQRLAWQQFNERRKDFRALTAPIRQCLTEVYDDKDLDDGEKLRRKQAIFDEFRSDYEALKMGPWKGYAGYDGWVARANNASFGTQAAYDQWVPAFEALFDQQGRDYPRFYTAVRALADMTAAERQAALERLTPPATSASIPHPLLSQEAHVPDSHSSSPSPRACRRPQDRLAMGRTG